MSDTLKEARRLWRLGFAIHHLHPNSKRPIGMEWASGERKSWDELKTSYRKDFNLGVRLGSPSKISNGYLAVIDVDIKSDLAHHREEALRALAGMVGKTVCPQVLSGRGGGSQHLYYLSKEPFTTWNPFHSEEQVKFLSPTKKPSKRELAELSEDEIKAGWRISRAWEISLYSEGRQVVLPPSVHPDTGKLYVWGVELTDASSLPQFDFSHLSNDKRGDSDEKRSRMSTPRGPQESVDDFVIDETLDIRWLPELTDSIRTLICDGIWKGEKVSDRSAYLLPAAKSLAGAGLGKNEILTILTDPSTYLGECCYEHAQTKNRRRAAKWLWNYTVKRVLVENESHNAFSNAIGEPVVLEGDALKTQTDELEAEDDPAKRGYYNRGKNGALKADYDSLLVAFEKERPFKTIVDMKTVFCFTGTHYEEMSPLSLRGFAERKMMPKPEEKIRQEFYHKVLANHQRPRREFFLETIENKINFNNGIVDLNTMELGAHSPDVGFRGVLPYDYDPSAKCPIFREWLNGVMLSDEGLQRVLQEFMGYIVRGGEYKYHKALWLGGIGRNGKSTFIDLLKALIGPQNFSTVSIKSLVGDKFAGAALDGMIANFSEETSPQELADSGPFKNLTGDGDMTVQKKFGDPYTYRNRAKLIMTYNQIPDLKDLSAGMLSRPIIIPFRKIISEAEQDRNIKQKLFAELPGIFNFALRGWKRLERQNGFTKSELSQLALQAIKQESCNVYQWVDQFIDFVGSEPNNPSRIFKPHELYALYQMRERYAYKAVEFYRRLIAHPQMKKRWKKTSSGNVYFGLKIR